MTNLSTSPRFSLCRRDRLARTCRQLLFGLIAVCPHIEPGASWAQDAIPKSGTSGKLQQLIGEDAPLSPPGFSSSRQMAAALSSGQVSPVDDDQSAQGVSIQRNLVYATVDGKSLKLDIYQPSKISDLLPGLLLIHGGNWKDGNKDEYRQFANEFAQHGYVVAAIDYRLAPDSRFPAPVQDCKAAVRWLRTNAHKFHVDPARIAVMGGGAGGSLALMTAYASGQSELEGDSNGSNVSSRVQAVIALYAPCDLTRDEITGHGLAGPAVASYLGNNKHTELAKQASPITHLSADDPPTLVIHGTIDAFFPVSQSDLLAEALERHGVPFVYDRIAGWPYVMDHARPIHDRCVWLAERFLARAMKSDPVVEAKADP